MENEYTKHIIYGNFHSMPGQDFPIDCETLAALQNNTQKLAVIASVAGCDRLILTGCGVQGNIRGDGYVFVRSSENPVTGEILYHPQQPTSDYCYIAETSINVNANAIEYSGAYTQRYLASGNGNGAMLWSSFKTLVNMSLSALLTAITDYKQTNDAVIAKIANMHPKFSIKTKIFTSFDGTTFAGKTILNCYVAAIGYTDYRYTMATQNGYELVLYGYAGESAGFHSITIRDDTTSANAWGSRCSLAYAFFTYLEYA